MPSILNCGNKSFLAFFLPEVISGEIFLLLSVIQLESVISKILICHNIVYMQYLLMSCTGREN